MQVCKLKGSDFMTQINIPLGIGSLTVTAQTIDKKGNIIIDVVSKCACSTCHKCGKPATKRNGVAPARLVRHLSILDTPVYLRITPIRYSCEYCDDHPTTTEQYDWCDRNSSTTKGLDDYIMRSLINSTIEDVAKKDQIGQKIMALLRICRNQKARGTLRSKDFSVKPIIRFSCFVASFLPLQGSL